MLKPDQAKARLAIWHLPPGTDRFEAGLKALPEGIQQAARTLCQPEETRSWDWESCRPKRQAARQFDQATVQDRRRLFALIAPRLESAMEAAWQLVKTGPYQVGYWSLPFRAPRHPTLLDDSLANWIEAIARFAKRFQPDILTAEWLATWGAHIQDGHSARSPIGLLLAAVLDSGSVEGDAVFEILRQSLTNEHEIGAAGRHVYSAFLLSQRRDGWELMEKMLLAAQRQEGLRQAILESIAATHPEAFRRMLRLILDHDLIRFSSVVRAVDVWFQQLWGPASAGVIKQMLTAVVGFLEDPAARDKALTGQDAPRAFLAMWCAATEDAVASIEPAAKLLRAQSVELRYVAVRHLSNLNMDRAAIALLPALGDEDLRVALWALLHGRYQGGVNEGEEVAKDDRFERIEQLLTRIPTHSIKLQPLVWPWTEIGVKQSEVAVCLLSCRNERPATRLIPHLPQLETHHRRRAVEEIAAARPWDATTRQALLDLAGDATEITRGAAIGALANEQLSVPESQQLEGYLTRKAGDLRRGILSLLLKQSDGAAVASGGRLLAAKDANQRLAGLELFRTMIDQNRSVAAVREQAAAYRAARRKLTKEELIHLTEIAADKAAVVTLDDALGLLNQADRTPGTPPRDLNAKFITPVAIACLHALDELVHQHRETTIEIKTWSGPAAELLGNSGHNFPGPDREQSIEQQLLRLPLAEVWRRWDAERGPELRDDDGFELLRASIAHELFHSHDQTRQLEWAGGSPQRKALYARVSGATRFSKLRYPGLVKRLLDWLIFISPKNAADYLLDAAETLFSLVPQEDIAELAKPYSVNNEWFHIHPIADWREVEFLTIWINCLISQRFSYCIPIGAAHILRLWKLTRWLDEPFAGARRHRANGTLLLAAYAIQGANRADITDYLLGPRAPNAPFDLLSSFTNRDRNCNLSAWLKTYPEVRALLDRVLARILDVELNRGDIPTPATAPAHAICAFWGIENLRRLLQALGKADFKLVERYGASVVDRRESLTKLIRAAYLGEGETPADFVRVMKAAVKAGQFSADRLLQLTFLAPQWTAGVEAYFGWEQMREGVYWFLAHMRYIAGSGENAALADATTDSPPPASPPPAAQTAEGAVAPAGAT
ncbi:MAG TPA: DUF5724 domain-containing protein, partial [Pirellulales bacterium]|nr:DUF5724 domain-containing protein [Pirellulales bacterium]